MARPTKLTFEVQRRIATAIKLGSSIEAACESAGISESAFYNWVERGEQEEEGIYVEFAVAIKKVKASAETRALSAIRKAFSVYNVKTVKTVTKPGGSVETTVTTRPLAGVIETEQARSCRVLQSG